jgi:hypothetical protein
MLQLPLEIDVSERLSISIADDKASPIQLGVGLVDGPGWREAVLGLFYRQDKNGLDAVMAPAQAFGEGWWLSPV